MNTPVDTLESCNRIAADGSVPLFWRTLAEHAAKLLGDQIYREGRESRHRAETKRLIRILTGREKRT